MNLISFRADGRSLYGLATDRGIIDASSRLGEEYETLRDVIEADTLEKVVGLANYDADFSYDDIQYDLPIPNARKIMCAGRNYRAYHEVQKDGGPEYPSIFARYTTSFAAHGMAMQVPSICERLDYEGELVAVIGQSGKHIPAEKALNHVVGYTIMNEGSPRKWERGGTQNFTVKNFDRCGGLGPWIVTENEIDDPMKLHITTLRNGEVVQDGATDLMIRDVPFLIAHISSFLELQAGDMIGTGSPGGTIVGSDNPNWLKAGEEIEVEISGIGVLQNQIVDE